jgi:hypothetical protein
MSADPEAMLYYGFPIEDPGFDYHDVTDEWRDSHRPPKPEVKGYTGPEWDKWREDNSRWEAGPENVCCDWHGSEDCEQYHIHCKSLLKSVEWAEFKEVDPAELAKPQPEADRFIREFCEKAGIEFVQPKWFLAAQYF